MVIDKTSQCGTERWAMTGRRWHGGRDRGTTRLLIGRIPLQSSVARTALTQAGRGGCWSTKKDEGSRDGEKEEGAWDKVGEGPGLWLGKCKCMNSSETPWNARTVVQMSELSISHSVSSLIYLTATLSKPGKPKSEWMMLGTFGEPRPPAAKGHLWMIFHLYCASPLCF